MAEHLSSYDKINHPNIHTRNWEAQSVRIVESKDPENGASQHRPLSCGRPQVPFNSDNRPFNLRGQYNSKNLILMPTDFVDERRTEGDEAEGYQVAKPHQGQSTSSSSNSITSSSIESTSTASTSAIRTPPSPKNTEVGDTSRPGVRFSDRGPPRTSTGHPTIYRRSSIGAGAAVEWGTLFDENGYATTRNNQFLRGLAKYIIDDLAPSSSSLVITPEKLCALYSRYRLNPETYPFIEILNSRARDAHDRLADFFTDLDCQYHLVQPDFYSRPRVPALTPAGFAQYFTTCILAHPDEEFRRLDKIVSDVQLVADTPVDGEPERLPRQLFRSQFPVRHDPKSKKILTAAIDDLIYDLRLQEPSSPRSPLAIMPPPPPSPGTKDRSIVPVIRRYVIPEEYTRRDEYKLAASPEAKQPCRRYLQSMNDEKSGRAPMGNRDREPYYGRERSHYNKESSGYRPAPSGDAGSVILYSPKSAYQRARSPPPRGHRASAPDVSSASTSYFRPAGYLPQPPLTIAERREYAMSLVNPDTAAENGAREETRRRESSGGRIETESPLIEAPAQGGGNEGTSSKALASSPTTATNTSSTALVTTTAQRQHSRRDSSCSKKGITDSATASSEAMSTGEKKHHHGHSHSHSHSHSHGHHRRRSVAEDDKGPTWEEALKSPSSSHHHRHHHHHHKTESSSKGGGRSQHSRRHSTY
ncbi:hypothetical protein F4813DRAFT_395176 [Daldinia decipiens]|uniref:uncharacterized protein n=1 Tax=Daldinia decipiens TaxID=326647 RepID=UPI0020C25AB5|nr:uncharacterized protein F4813DRAFT_395176 [Daldinia decipiens]KAI1659244.1 hypothetical protein F4813DRAFT_395176 [Daldinia decipiens]